MQGFLNLEKPADWTSHDCVARVRRLLRLKRVGHGGTLDPAATGVLPIALGRATRLLPYLASDKCYLATIRFGIRTTTDDLEGDELTNQPAPQLTLDQVKTILPQFQGQIQQIPPRYSAIQVQGKRLYDLARSGQAVDVPVRTVTVHDIQVLDWRSQDYPELEVAIACGTGTYIRAIARDLGDCLAVGATLAKLVRTVSSGFRLEESVSLADLEQQIDQGRFQPLSPEQALQHLPAIALSDELARRWGHGQILHDPAEFKTQAPGLYRIHHIDGTFRGIGELFQDEETLSLRSNMVFVPS